MSELRLNVVTKEWVIIAPERASRPDEFSRLINRPPRPAHAPNCPFCPGNEADTAAEVFRIVRTSDGGWQTRVVENKYPVLTRLSKRIQSRHRGLMHAVDGYGVHEVVIDTPRHDLTVALLPTPEVEAIIESYRNRYQACMSDNRIAHIVIFKNHGPGAGTSLIHPHSQVIGIPVVSYQVRDRIRTMEEHLALHGDCALCQMIQDEIEAEERILYQNDSFVALIPYAALSRYHIWIFPKRHMARFGEMSEDEVPELAQTLRHVLRMLYYGLGDPDFNYIVRSSPRGCAPEAFHWYISIVPRTGQAAGFELGSGMFVNPSLPEQSAAFLRSVTLPPDDA